MYSELERLFGLESLIINKEDPPGGGNSPPKEAASPAKAEESNGWGSRILGRSWRDLIPVIKIEISCVSISNLNRIKNDFDLCESKMVLIIWNWVFIEFLISNLIQLLR